MLYVSLETDFILALEMGEDFALSAIDAITQSRGFPLVVPSVIQELTWISKHHEQESFRIAAGKALKSFSNHHFIFPSIDSTKHYVAEITAKKLVAAGVFECFQSALVIAESALLDCRVMLTYKLRTTSLDVEMLQSLKLHLVAAAETDCTPMPPHVFVQFFTTSAQS